MSTFKLSLSALLLCVITNVSQAETIREFHERMCAAGKQASCEKSAALKQGEDHAGWIDQLGDEFSPELAKNAMEEDGKPDLKKAYELVLADYFQAELREHNKERKINDGLLEFCSSHYHNYWRNKKMIWPVNEQQEPDWPAIYFFIVEHYYGYCLRSQ